MTPERWKQIQAKLDIALALLPDERESFLHQLADTDVELQKEVQSLLSYESSSFNFLSHTALAPRFGKELQPKRAVIGERLFGPFQLTGLVGAGGMADVYRAVRADGQYKQEVALKIIRSDFTGELTSRFRKERQILATLDHPNIARILDGNTTDDGIPYFVMELIEGLPITEYADGHNLSIDSRLKLFRSVCSAVHYAHQHLIVHRDIKPSNILVTKDGIPKLLDFGIAKVLNPSPARQNTTRAGLLMMTPEYSSPEQLRGQPVTTATDVYSLGLVLYELLTGCHAFQSCGNMPHEVARGVLELEPQKPSNALRQRRPHPLRKQTKPANSIAESREASPEKLSRRLSGDLDSIVLKALRQDPRDRYNSVDQFSEDIRRHLEGLPILARKGTLSYRVFKYVVRHKVGVASAALLLLTLVTGIVVTLREARIAQQNEVRAERRFNDVRQLANALLFDIHDSVKDLPGSTPARKRIVQNALQYLDSLSSEAAGDPSLQRELATAYERVGEVQGQFGLSNLGETENSLHSYQQALRLRRDLLKGPRSSWQDQLAMARCYRIVAIQLQAMGKVREALESVQAGISLAESIRQQHPQETRILDELDREFEENGRLHRGRGVFPGLVDIAGESESYLKAMAVAEDWLKLSPSSQDAQNALTWDQMNYADTLPEPRQAEALRYYQRAVATAEEIERRNPSPHHAGTLAATYNHLGMFYSDRDPAKSVEAQRNALKIDQEISDQDPRNKDALRSLSIEHANISDGLLKMGQIGESKAEVARAIELMEGLVRTDPENLSQQNMLAQMHINRGKIFRNSGDPAAALPDYKFALALYRKTLEKDNNNAGAAMHVAACSIGIAKTELQLRHSQAASASFQTAADALKPLLSAHTTEPGTRYAAADTYAGLGRLELAEAVRAPQSEATPHWKAAASWFRLSLEQLNEVPQLTRTVDNDIGPVDSVQINQQLRRCVSALHHSKS